MSEGFTYVFVLPLSSVCNADVPNIYLLQIKRDSPVLNLDPDAFCMLFDPPLSLERSFKDLRMLHSILAFPRNVLFMDKDS